MTVPHSINIYGCVSARAQPSGDRNAIISLFYYTHNFVPDSKAGDAKRVKEPLGGLQLLVGGNTFAKPGLCEILIS